MHVPGTIDRGAGPSRLLKQGREVGQFVAASDQFLNGAVDNVGEFLVALGRLTHGAGQQVPSVLVEGEDTLMVPDDGDVSAPGARVVVVGQVGRGNEESLVTGNVLNNGDWHVPQGHEVAQPLERL